LSEQQWRRIQLLADEARSKPLFMYDIGGLNIYDLRSMCRSLKFKYQIEAVFVDYLQLLNADGGEKKFGIREQEVNFVSKQLKAMAKELKLPVIALSQLNRGQKGITRMYVIDDLRDSGAIGQDADGVIFVWRPEYHGVERYSLDLREETVFQRGDAVIKKAKWRLGNTGHYMMKFSGATSKFLDYNEMRVYNPAQVSEVTKPDAKSEDATPPDDALPF